MVFGTLSVGAVVLTFNVILLGGNIGFFQAMCLLGYCIFPIDVAAIVCAATKNQIARWVSASSAWLVPNVRVGLRRLCFRRMLPMWAASDHSRRNEVIKATKISCTTDQMQEG